MPIYTRARAIAMPQKPGIAGMYEQVEAAARTCYRSEGFTKYDEQGNSITAGEFVPRIMKAYKHESVGEHGTVTLLTVNFVDIDLQHIGGFRNTLQIHTQE